MTVQSEATTLHAAGLPPIGTSVGGKYRLERYIAEGGMGVIAIARHIELDELVAVKFLKPAVLSADPTVGGRFVREARATIKIRSEHVPRIFDVATLDTGVPYIVMELLVGEDLDTHLEARGPLAVPFAIDLLLQSLEALAAAHALGMVHRDYKPANLFMAKRLDGSTCVKVLDFGIAKLVDQNGTANDLGLTGTNTTMGSPRYMSPEQMRSARDVDGRADIWAVGTTLYELLTGAAPFDGASLTQVCAAVMQDEPAPMTRHRPDVPVQLENIVRRCLAKRPGDRFANVADLAAALAPFGTTPSAYEMAMRVARVIGASSSTLASASPASATGPALPIAPFDGVTQGMSPGSSSPGMGITHTSWGPADASSLTRRRGFWTVASVFAFLFVTGSVLGGVALYRARNPRASSLDAAAANGGGVATASAATSESPSPPTTAAPSVASPSESTSSAAPSASASVALESTAKSPSKTSGNVKPAAGGAKPAAAPARTTKPTSSPPPGGLWDDRK